MQSKGPHPATIPSKRQRQRNLDAMGRKSRRKAANNAFADKQNEQNLRGMARVYFGARGSVAMQENVSKAVYAFACSLADEKDIVIEEAIKEVEEMLHDIGVAYGDLDDPRDAN